MNQAPSWYLNNFLLPNPHKFQFSIINPRKVDKDKNDTTLTIGGIDIIKAEIMKLLGSLYQ